MTPRRPTAQAWHDVRLPLRRVEARVTGEVPERRDDVWPFDIPAVAQLLREGLDLGPATVLVGENGAGKSTLVEGIAMAYGLNPEGGSTGDGTSPISRITSRRAAQSSRSRFSRTLIEKSSKRPMTKVRSRRASASRPA